MTRRIDNGSVVPESQLVDAVDGDGNPVNLTEIANGKDVKVPYNDGTNRVRVYRGTSGERATASTSK